MNRSTNWFRHSALGICALALTVTLSACNGGNIMGPNPNAKVATVDNAVITRGEYDKTYKMVSQNLGVNMENTVDPSQKAMITQAVTQMTLNKLILDKLVENEAKSLKLTVTDAEVKAFKDKEFADSKKKAELKKLLDEKRMSEKDFDEMLKQNLLTEKVIEHKAGDQVAVTDSEVTAFFSGHPEQFKMPEQIKTSHILIKAISRQMASELKAQSPSKPDAEIKKEVEAQRAELKAKAETILAKVQKNPKDFAEIAKRESNDPGSAKEGGELGYVVQSNMVPEFWAALKETKPGQLHNGVVETQYGYHIVKVEDVKPPKTSTLAEMRPMIQQFLEGQKKQKVLMQWANEKRALAKIQIEPEFQPKAPTAPTGPQPDANGQVSLGGSGKVTGQ